MSQSLEDILKRNPDLKVISDTGNTPLNLQNGMPVASSGTSKYHNHRTELEGLIFDSSKEAVRYQELRLLEKTHKIFCLCVHVRIPIPGHAFYEADFLYINENLKVIIEDVKVEATKTAVYRLKKKLIKEKYGIEIREV